MIQQNLKDRILTSFILLLLVFFALNYNFLLVYLLIIFGVFSFIEFSNLIKKTARYFFFLIVTIFQYIFILFSFIFLFLTIYYQKLFF